MSEEALLEIIQKHGIKTILNLRTSGNTKEWYLKEKSIADTYGITLNSVHLYYNELPEYTKLVNIIEILNKSEKPLLIHCKRGADRTGLISAIALTIDQDPPLSEIRKQFSWRFGVLPFYTSIGPKFFGKYEKWLNEANKEHSKDTLLYWINNKYVDSYGNIKFWVDYVNGIKIDKSNTVTLEKDSLNKISIEGWAFDVKSKGPLADLHIAFDNGINSKITYRRNEPSIAKYFRLGEKYYKNFPVIWGVDFDKHLFPAGCHKIFLQFSRNSTEPDTVETKFRICIKD